MNKKLILIFVVLLLLVVAGCEGRFFKKVSGRDRPITDADIRQGTEGLTMEFTINTPPRKVFEGTEESSGIFPIAVSLWNRGATDIKPMDAIYYEEENKVDADNFPYTEVNKKIKTVEGKLVFGFEKTFVDFDEDSKRKLEKKLIIDVKDRIKFELNGKSIFNPDGENDFITIDARAKKIGEQSEKQPSVILATACYPYKTVFGTSVCVDTDVYGIRQGRKACSVDILKFKSGQGAPVAVTKVETRILPQDGNKVKPLFLIHIENKGNGEVVKLSETEKACGKEALGYRDFSTININATLSGTLLDCRISKGSGPEPPEPAVIRLRDKKFMVRCILRDNDAIDADIDAYITALSVELNYGYTFTISKNIIIEKILTY